MSPGNLTFHYPTKDHLLAELVEMLCVHQWNMIEKEIDDGCSSVLAICFEIAYMVSICDSDEIIRDFIVSAYRSPVCLEIIRRNDCSRAKEIFKNYCPHWTDEQFAEAEILVSGIEYATLMTAGENVPIETRISGAMQNILRIYGVPEEIRDLKLKKLFESDFRKEAICILEDFKEYVKIANEQAFSDLLKK